jgi:uncharacterized coiled-coil DUF342 family protein
MSGEHTAGPWEAAIERDRLQTRVRELMGEASELAADLQRTMAERDVILAERDRLRAEKAELVAALQSYIRLFDTMANGLEVSPGELFTAREEMRSCIAKATATEGGE